MRKLLLITLVAGGLVFASVPRSDAQVYFSVGFGPGYYGYYPSRYYYPYRYYRPYYGSYYRPNYWYGGHRYYFHYPHQHYHRRQVDVETRKTKHNGSRATFGEFFFFVNPFSSDKSGTIISFVLRSS